MQSTSTSSNKSEDTALKTRLRDVISIWACIATGIAAILGTWHARSNVNVNLLAVDFLLVPVAQIFLAITCMIVLQAPRKLPRWWLLAISFAGASICIEIARAATTMLVFGGLAMQGIMLLLTVLLAWLAARGKLNIESTQNTAKGIVIFGGLLYGAFALTWMPRVSIYLLFVMLLASWLSRASIRQWYQLPTLSPAVKHSLLDLIILVLVATAALLLFSMLAVPSPMLFLYPALAGWGIIAIEGIAAIHPMIKSSILFKLLDALIAVEFLAILLGSA